jgi:hypothetical protein
MIHDCATGVARSQQTLDGVAKVIDGPNPMTRLKTIRLIA